MNTLKQDNYSKNGAYNYCNELYAEDIGTKGEIWKALMQTNFNKDEARLLVLKDKSNMS